jgi:hypothetical protein
MLHSLMLADEELGSVNMQSEVEKYEFVFALAA